MRLGITKPDINNPAMAQTNVRIERIATQRIEIFIYLQFCTRFLSQALAVASRVCEGDFGFGFHDMGGISLAVL